jgi:uncharacterized repeat protein (TIGR04138 family)
MQCDKCKKNDATIFLTQIVDGHTTKASLCATCGVPFTEEIRSSPEFIKRLREAGFAMGSYGQMFEDRFEKVAARDLRYTKEAFRFVRDGVDRAMKSVGRRHVTAKELLEALRSVAIERYGSGAHEQLRSWGITRCEDFGEIVFTLIENGIFGKQPEDRKEDFENGYDFATAFPTVNKR